MLTILCFDRLEYDYATPTLRQSYCGKYSIDVNKNSVQLWASFLTGREIEYGEFIEKRKWCKWLKLKPIYPIIWLKPTWFFKTPSFKGETFLDEYRSLVVNIFCYNEDPRSLTFRYRYSITRALKASL